MNRQRVINIIREPLQMQHEQDLPLIKELIEEFPYFSTPYILLTRLLSEQKSIYLDKYLKLSASYIGDREVLYNLIHAAPKLETPVITEENNAVQVQKTETEKPAEVEVKTEISPAPEQSISADTYISKAAEIAEPELIVTDTKEQEFPAEAEVQPTIATDEIAHPETEIKEEIAEIEAQEHPAYIESEKNTSEINDASENDVIEFNNMPLEEVSATETEEETTEQADIKPVFETENSAVTEDYSKQVNLAIQETLKPENLLEKDLAEEATNFTEPENFVETPTQEEIKKPEAKKIDLDLPPLAAYDYFAFREKKPKKAEETETPAITEPIETKAENISTEKANNTETLSPQKPSGKISFGSWLTAIGQNKTAPPVTFQEEKPAPIITETVQKHPIKLERKPKREDVEDIISKFIQTEPRIKPKPAKFFTPQDVAERSAEQDNTLVTETLANIYLKQGLTDKAVEIFQQLMLKYPQKSDYFAVKIQEINTKAV